MNYYKLSISCNTKETGPVYPQIQKMVPNYDNKDKKSVYSLSKFYNSFPNFEPNLNGFVIQGRAKLTDFLSNSIIRTNGFLLSENAKQIFESCNLNGYKFYQAKIFYKKNCFNYFWLHFISNVRNSIDYGKSRFFIFQNFSKKLEYIDVISEEDLIEKEKSLQEKNPGKTIVIWAETIYLNSSFDKKLDFFKVGKFDSNYYVSEHLRNLFIEQNITGIEFCEAANIIIL